MQHAQQGLVGVSAFGLGREHVLIAFGDPGLKFVGFLFLVFFAKFLLFVLLFGHEFLLAVAGCCADLFLKSFVLGRELGDFILVHFGERGEIIGG